MQIWPNPSSAPRIQGRVAPPSSEHVALHFATTRTNTIKVFMTRDDLTSIHEPFGDAFYYGYYHVLSPRLLDLIFAAAPKG